MRSSSPNRGRSRLRLAWAAGVLLVVVFISSPLCARVAPRDFNREPPTRDKERIRQIREVVARAYGGHEALRSINAVYARGTISSRLRDGGKGRYEHYFQRPGRLRVDIQYAQAQERKLLIDRRVWSALGGGPFVPAQAPARWGLLYQYHEIDLISGLVEGRYDMIFLGEADLGGRDSYMLGVKVAEGLRLEVFVDKQNSLIVKVRGYFNLKKARGYMTSEYSDFRWAGEIVLPHKIVNFVNGRRMGETLIEEYRINPPIGDEVFRP